MKTRATILDTGDPFLISAEIEINAPDRVIFDLLADPKRHADFDGSGSIKRVISGPKRLYLGAKFGMAMKIKVPYRITNEVIAFEEDRLIAWRHLMRWQWRYEIEPTATGGCIVRESFDGNHSRSKRWLQLTGALKANPIMIAKSLVRLKALAEKA
jgi:uncharacterized protein YndB with AHSA1/START domain